MQLIQRVVGDHPEDTLQIPSLSTPPFVSCLVSSAIPANSNKHRGNKGYLGVLATW